MRVVDQPSAVRSLLLLSLLAAMAGGLHRDAAPVQRPLRHEAYVWRHRWGPAMAAAIASRPGELSALRVLGLYWGADGGAPKATDVNLRALAAAGPITLVARIEGARLPTALTLGPLVTLAQRWRAAGVQVRGVEVDHDCATAALPAYTRWLRSQRPLVADALQLEVALAVTALPTWLDDPASVRALSATVDRVTLQVHTIAAPTIFDAESALAAARAWAEASDRPFWIALPTYRARLRHGDIVGVEPAAVAQTLQALRTSPIEGLRGAVWFRLGYSGDDDAWPAVTLAALIRGEDVRGEVLVSLRRAGPELWDIVAAAHGNAPGPVPALLRFDGRVTALQGANGCRREGRGLRCPQELRIPVGQERVLGYVRGQEVRRGG